jgi:predicted S18 family serine protease
MKKVIKLTESDLNHIVKTVLNEKRLSASELIKDMTLRDVVDVVNSFSNKQISVKEVKEKIEYMFRPSGGRLNEMDEVLNEDRGSLGSIKDDYRSVSQKLARSIEEYDALSRKGEYKRMGDELDNLRRLIRKLKDVLQNIESKL